MIIKLPATNEKTVTVAQAAPQQMSDPLIPTIFHEPWWLDIVTGGNYKVAEVSANGRIVGRLPYLVKRKLGQSMTFMPPMTHFLGPAIDEGEGSANTRFLKRMAITRDLIAAMEPMATIKINCHRQVTDVIAFQEQGFHSSVQFTYELAPRPEAEIWKNMRDKTRNVIRRAQEKITVAKIDDAARFMTFYESNLTISGKQNYMSREMCIRLIETCLHKNCGAIFGAYNDKGELLSAIFCVWDRSSYFYLMSTRRFNSGNGGISLLLWEALKDASARNLIFDFDGLSQKGGILFYTGFGGTTSPRYIVKRSTKYFRAFHEIKGMIFGENNFC